ncbi:hypothetical protein KPATCC21470_7958 [Kitasatospora purpeofusca]
MPQVTVPQVVVLRIVRSQVVMPVTYPPVPGRHARSTRKCAP